MAKDSPKNLGSDFLNNVWGKRVRGLPVSTIDWSAPVRHQDVLFLLGRYPFLQMVNPEPRNVEGVDVKLITSASGWVIHDYGDAMSSSPGKLLYGPEDENEQGGGGGGAGTIVNQAVLTAQEMVEIAAEHGWTGIQIVDGAELMQWAAWVKAEQLGMALHGFEPTKADREKKARISKYLVEITASTTPRLGK